MSLPKKTESLLKNSPLILSFRWNHLTSQRHKNDKLYPALHEFQCFNTHMAHLLRLYQRRGSTYNSLFINLTEAQKNIFFEQ